MQELEKVKSRINAPNESDLAQIDELKVEERKSIPKGKVNMINCADTTATAITRNCQKY
jgi:hypothetical protein